MTNNEHLFDKALDVWIKQLPQIKDVIEMIPITWENPLLNHSKIEFDEELGNARERWRRFAPYLQTAFPELHRTNGVIDSNLQKINNMKQYLANHYQVNITGELYMKCDHQLPIAGSVKARGGIYEVLTYAEKIGFQHNMLSIDDPYSVLNEPRFKQLFSNYTIGVGSTGNLALSIGIISAKLGFKVNVYMSMDAKQWKKDLLRNKGVHVHECSGDFSDAVKYGRIRTSLAPNGYFVDDENSKDLFYGYSTAAFHLQKQLNNKGIQVDHHHPLYVYLPCGVGGAPSGISAGLKGIFGSHVHCYFAEPTHAPAVLLGLMTNKLDKVCVQDFGIDGRTEADGLAVGRPSAFAIKKIQSLIDGIYTMDDDELFKLLSLLFDSENIAIEPSAAASLLGPVEIARRESIPKKTTHVVWATGGSFVPREEMLDFYEKGKLLLNLN
ncbi:D-serine ammonia-lyase [Aquibacillus koreensis]|uniref:Probable D-serine dehydratase n=1 Tax=Aquibacillus koreensis TaxID=279446 RepID=A0A9X4AJ73_9BACI|nr:D-serine ammonia-lyase [Aquibacillus koreensis]MCT2536942.1 D-serine ammonia-lyase [Aquibacillus koreensis]MDC3421927.1 D-serine ammonia-lyase [Aquibacillus koreensis]